MFPKRTQVDDNYANLHHFVVTVLYQLYSITKDIIIYSTPEQKSAQVCGSSRQCSGYSWAYSSKYNIMVTVTHFCFQDLLLLQAHPNISKDLLPEFPGNIHQVQYPSHLPNNFIKAVQFVKNFHDLSTPRYDDNYAQTELILCEETLKNVELTNFMKSVKYDVGISMAYNFCGTGLFSLFGIPSIHTMTPHPNNDGTFEFFGIPSPSYLPSKYCIYDAFHYFQVQTLRTIKVTPWLCGRESTTLTKNICMQLLL